jgi:hypothetical protein
MASSNMKMLKMTGVNKESDECYTPQSGIHPLLEFLDSGMVFYDCTSGISSNIVNTLNYNGFKCLSSGDKDFLSDEIPDDVDVIITNPPYSQKDKFIARCYELGKPFALLLPVSALQGQTRGKMFIDNGIEILALNSRIDFTGKGSPHFGVAWFCYKLLPEKLLFR